MQDFRDLMRYLALENAERYGSTKLETVMGHLLSRVPELRSHVSELRDVVAEEVRIVNSMPPEERRSLLGSMRLRYGEQLPRTIRKFRGGLPELQPHDELPGFRLRFAPNPDGPLTLGNARPAILCDHYARRYNGTFILRFEDTSPSVKPPLSDAYSLIIEDLEWLGIKSDEVYYQSDRLEIYYARAREFIENGLAYVCLCKPHEWKDYVSRMRPCPHRPTSPDINLRLFQMMVVGGLDAGDAVVRVKTDVTDPNPAVRDWPALRIDTALHPRVGDRYRVWPLYNWACAIDDHELKITHIIRGKEHMTNEARQSYVFRGFDWPTPIVLHIGRLKLEGVTLSKSKMMKELRSGALRGMDDPRLGTILAIRRRGFKPDVIKAIILDMGLKPVEATLKWDNLYSANRIAIDRETPRAFFIFDAYKLEVENAPRIDKVTLPRHPDNSQLGVRDIPVPYENGIVHLGISGPDVEKIESGSRARLIGLFNIEVTGMDKGRRVVFANCVGSSHEDAIKNRLPLLQWTPHGLSVSTTVLMPDVSEIKGESEPAIADLKTGDMVQFLRFGFVRYEGESQFIFAHN